MIVNERKNLTEVLWNKVEYCDVEPTNRGGTSISLFFAGKEGENVNILIDVYDQLKRYELNKYFSDYELRKFAKKTKEKTIKEFCSNLREFDDLYANTDKRFKFNIAEMVKDNAKKTIGSYLLSDKRVVL